MLLALLKCYPTVNFHQSSNGLFTLVDEFLYYAYELEQLAEPEPQFQLLDEIDRVMSIHANEERVHWTNGRDLPTTTADVQWIFLQRCTDPNELIPVYGGQTPLGLFVPFAYERCKGLNQPAGQDNPFFEAACRLLECNADLDHIVHLPWIPWYLDATARFETQVTVERNQASARVLLAASFTPQEMLTLGCIMQGARLRTENLAVGWVDWFKSMVPGAG
ncbi:hypothetical protein BDV19DRAFT_387901 [Aspergillus venezuelensis]